MIETLMTASHKRVYVVMGDPTTVHAALNVPSYDDSSVIVASMSKDLSDLIHALIFPTAYFFSEVDLLRSLICGLDYSNDVHNAGIAPVILIIVRTNIFLDQRRILGKMRLKFFK